MTASAPTIARLRKRRDFLAAAKGSRVSRRPFVLQARPRGDAEAPRLGFTVSKRTAKKAVERNRVRRRLREAARLVAMEARAGHDYVIVGRREALTEPFAALTSALADAMRKAAKADDPAGKAQRSER